MRWNNNVSMKKQDGGSGGGKMTTYRHRRKLAIPPEYSHHRSRHRRTSCRLSPKIRAKYFQIQYIMLVMVTYGLENVYNEYTMHFSTINQRNHSISKIKIKIIIISIICDIIFDMVSQLQILTHLSNVGVLDYSKTVVLASQSLLR